MNVLLLGAGGREHAMALAIAGSPLLGALYAAPGNPGIAALATCLALDPCDGTAVVAACRAHAIDFVVVGPEAPLVAGLVDVLAVAGIKAFGPTKAAARLEGSKGFTKDFCARHAIPTAAYRRFDDFETARAYLAAVGAPIVVKADGLAAGKGVVVAATLAEAAAALEAIFAGHGDGNGASVVVEAVLQGHEASFFALCDGVRALPFASARDHKRVGDGDIGPNTGGMGAVSPAALIDDAMRTRVMAAIIEPTLRGMAAEGAPFTGVLFAGLMIGPEGPSLIEYNVRFGDPETQAMLPRLRGDFLGLLLACAEGALPLAPPAFSDEVAVTLVIAAAGYPASPRTGGLIRGLAGLSGVTVTHAGTKRLGADLVADGGRVLGLTATATTIPQARRAVYAAAAAIDWPDGFYRSDIGIEAATKSA